MAEFNQAWCRALFAQAGILHITNFLSLGRQYIAQIQPVDRVGVTSTPIFLLTSVEQFAYTNSWVGGKGMITVNRSYKSCLCEVCQCVYRSMILTRPTQVQGVKESNLQTMKWIQFFPCFF